MDYLKIRSRPESFQSLTSVTIEEFDEILAYFEREIKWEFRLNSRGKIRKNKGCFPEVLPDAFIFLFFTIDFICNNMYTFFCLLIINEL